MPVATFVTVMVTPDKNPAGCRIRDQAGQGRALGQREILDNGIAERQGHRGRWRGSTRWQLTEIV